MSQLLDLIIIGAGPAGLACAIEARKRGLDFWVLERGCLVNSIYKYPVNMTFFTTADLLEIGDVPMIISADKPKRIDGLKYYRRVVEHYELPIRDYEEVLTVQGSLGDFLVKSRDRLGNPHHYRTCRIVVATGYYDNPNLLGIPGEDLPKVSHYYTDPHPYYGKNVAVIGGNNSAAESALELFRSGSKVTLIHRGEHVGSKIKYWVLPDIENRIKNEEIPALFSSRVVEIRPQSIVVETPGGIVELDNDFVLAMTGYHPDSRFLRQMGIRVEPETHIPDHDPETLETNVAGIYLAGSICAGKMTNRIFIENGRFHGGQIFSHWNTSRPAAAID